MEESMMANGTQLDYGRDHRWDHRRVAMGTEVFGRPKKPRLDHDGIAIGTTRRFETGTEVFGYGDRGTRFKQMIGLKNCSRGLPGKGAGGQI